MLLLTISRLLKVDIGVAKGPTGDHVTADPTIQKKILVQCRVKKPGNKV